MSRNKNSFKVKLIVLLSGKFMGPITLKIYPHHKPNILTSLEMDEVLQLPQEMRIDTPRRVFWIEGLKFLDNSETYDAQKIHSENILILTDESDEQRLYNLAQVIIDLSRISTDEEYKASKPKVLVRGALKGVPWVGPLLDAIFFGGD